MSSPLVKFLVAAALVAGSCGAAAQQGAVPLKFSQVPMSDPVVKKIWGTLGQEMDISRAYVSYVREASGSLLTVSLLVSPDNCGPGGCGIRLQRDGKEINVFGGCDETDKYSISADGRTLTACDGAYAIAQ